MAFPCVAIAQIATLQIKVLEGEGAVHRPGSRSAKPLTVQLTDEAGRQVVGAAVSFHLPEEGPGGWCSNGLRTELAITDAEGRASLRGLQLNRSPGPFRIRITAAKDQARSGTVSLQYISEAKGSPSPISSSSHSVKAKAAGTSSRKWFVFGLVVGGAAGGIAIGLRGNTRSAPSAGPVVSVGAPTISVGRP